MHPSQILLGFSSLCFVQGLSMMQSPMGPMGGSGMDESCHDSMAATASMGQVTPMMVAKTDVGPFGCSAGACPGAPTCPDGNNTIKISGRGTPFMLKCSQNVNTGKFTREKLKTFDDCVDFCAGRAGCLAAEWWEAAKTCYQSYETISLAPTFENKALNSAIKMSTGLAPIAKCDTDNRQKIKSGSRIYEIRCGLNSDSPVIKTENGTTYERCADLCDETVGCAFVIAKDNGDCSLRSTWVNPDTSSTTASGQAWLAPITGISSTCCGSL